MSQSPEPQEQMSPLDLLMTRDPLELSNKQIDDVVAVLRKARDRWEIEKVEAKAQGRRAKAPTVDVGLKDLGL